MLHNTWIKSTIYTWSDSGAALDTYITKDGVILPIDHVQIYYQDGPQSDSSASPVTYSYAPYTYASGDKTNVLWYSALHISGSPACGGASTLTQCINSGSIAAVASVATSTNGTAGAVTSWEPTYTIAATTSTSSPPSYHNVISADGVVLGGLILVVITLLLWKQSSAR